MMTARAIEALAKRLERAREIVSAGKVWRVEGREGVYCVINGDGNAVYLVEQAKSCSCPDFVKNQGKFPCKHLLAVDLYQQQGTPRSEQDTPRSESVPTRSAGTKRKPPVRVVRAVEPDDLPPPPAIEMEEDAFAPL